MVSGVGSCTAQFEHVWVLCPYISFPQSWLQRLLHFDLFYHKSFALQLLLIFWEDIIEVAGFVYQFIRFEVRFLLVNMLHATRLLSNNLFTFLPLRCPLALQLQHLLQIAVLWLNWQSERLDRCEVWILKHGALSEPVVLEEDVRVGVYVFVAAGCRDYALRQLSALSVAHKDLVGLRWAVNVTRTRLTSIITAYAVGTWSLQYKLLLHHLGSEIGLFLIVGTIVAVSILGW